MRPEQVIGEIRSALQNHSNLPSNVNYVDEEPATSAEHAAVKLPIISFEIQSIEDIDEFNTDLEENILNSEGDVIGQRFRAQYEMGLQIDMMTAAESKYSRSTLGGEIQNTLYRYVDEGPDVQLHPDIWMFRIDDEDTVDDFTTSPTLRMWRLNLTVGSYTEFDVSADEDIESFNLNDPTVN
jgi:hypothetical protein